MKISKITLDVLKNFALINKGIILRQGNVLRSIADLNNLYAEATVAETFDTDIAIYDLNSLLNVVSLFKDPTFDFQEDHMVITEVDGKGSVIYRYAAHQMVKSPDPTKKIKVPAETFTFELSDEQLQTIVKAASVLQKPEMVISSDGTAIVITTEDQRNVNGHSYRFEAEGNPNNITCKMMVNIDLLKFLRGDYQVTVSKPVTLFKNKSMELAYYVASDPSSVFNGD